MIDLHIHLDGSLTPEEVTALAKLSGTVLPAENIEMLGKMLTAEPDCRNLAEYLEKFTLPLEVLQHKDAIALAVYGLLKRLAGQGLCYAEIRFAPQLHTKAGLTQREVVKSALKGLKDGIQDFKMPAKLILCCMRGDDNQEENLETVRVAAEYLGEGVCAVDLAGNEAAYPTENFSDVFAFAKKQNLPVVIHAGEAAGAESVRQALQLGALRIGHGIRSLEDRNLIEELRERKTVLELCYTSNLQTKAVGKKEEYPLGRFLAEGIAVTVNTDNMTVSGTTLKREYRLLQEQFGLSEDTLKQLALCAAEGAFLTKEEKEDVAKQIEKKFSGWLADSSDSCDKTAC